MTIAEMLRALHQYRPPYLSIDSHALGLDTEEWIAYLVKRYGMEIIEFDAEREVQAVEVTNKSGYAAFRVEVAVRPSDTLQVIFEHGLVGQSYSLLSCRASRRSAVP